MAKTKKVDNPDSTNLARREIDDPESRESTLNNSGNDSDNPDTGSENSENGLDKSENGLDNSENGFLVKVNPKILPSGEMLLGQDFIDTMVAVLSKSFSKYQETNPGFKAPRLSNLQDEVNKSNDREITSVTGNGHYSKYNKDTIRTVLEKMRKSESRKKTDIFTFDSYRKHVDDIIKKVLMGLKEIKPENAYKWLETLEKFFKKFPGSKEILTTKDYEEADFKKRKVNWNPYTFCGNDNLRSALNVLDTKFMEECRIRGLINENEFDPETASIKDLWVKAKHYSMSRTVEPLNTYFVGSLAFWKTVTNNVPEDEIQSYRILMNKNFDMSFIHFMESLGHATFMLWVWFLNTSLGTYFVKVIAELEAEYRKKPFIVQGVFTVLTKLKDSEAWRNALDKERNRTASELEERKRRLGTDVKLFPDSKRTRYPHPPIRNGTAQRSGEHGSWKDLIREDLKSQSEVFKEAMDEKRTAEMNPDHKN